MVQAFILFGTTTGNTESMAQIVRKALENCDIQAHVKDVAQADVQDLTADHDLLLLGCPAYGDDAIELQEDFEEFYEKLDGGVALNGKKFAVFAPGDSSYEYFCGSVDMLEDKMEELGGEKMTPGLKVDGDPEDSHEEIVGWVEAIASQLK